MVGRPRKAAVVASETAAPQIEGEAVPKKHRRRRASVGGFKLKLQAPERPGFVRRFVLNDPSRILEMHELGYDFAEEENTATVSEGTRVERHAGKDADGRPQRLVLMETPISEYAVGQAEKEERLKPFDEALKRGVDPTGRVQDQYSPSDKSSLTHSSTA